MLRRILRILIKPHKKFKLRIYFIILTLLITSFFCALFGHLFERLELEIELRLSRNLSVQKQSIRYSYNRSTNRKSFLLKSECDCRKWETISIEQINEESDYSSNC